MTAFRLWSNGEPDVGDTLRNVDTGNRWVIDSARAVQVREPDPRYVYVWSLQVHRIGPDDQVHPDSVEWPFVRDQPRRRW